MPEPNVEKLDRLSTLSRLRQATERSHLRLHENPLMAELLEHPSVDSYATVLLRFLRFYDSLEPQLVRDAQLLGCSTYYPRAERIEWLSADLEALSVDPRQNNPMVNDKGGGEPPTIGDFVGRLYVVRGSALGGRSIMRALSPKMEISHCCRFFHAGGAEQVANHWRAFQEFCEQSCPCEDSRASAAISARSAFDAIEECFT